MAYSIENLMDVIGASHANRRPLAEVARDETIKALRDGDPLPEFSGLNPELEIDAESADYRKWPADMVLQQQGAHKDQWRITTWGEFEDVGTRTPEQAVDHAIGQIIEGCGKVKHALEIIKAAYHKNEWRRHVEKMEPQEQVDFENSVLLLLGEKATGIRGTYFEKMRQNAAAAGGSQEPCPQAAGSAESASA